MQLDVGADVRDLLLQVRLRRQQFGGLCLAVGAQLLFGLADGRVIIFERTAHNGPAARATHQNDAQKDRNAVVFQLDVGPRGVDEHLDAQPDEHHRGQAQRPAHIKRRQNAAEHQQHARRHQHKAEREGPGAADLFGRFFPQRRHGVRRGAGLRPGRAFTRAWLRVGGCIMHIVFFIHGNTPRIFVSGKTPPRAGRAPAPGRRRGHFPPCGWSWPSCSSCSPG